MSRRAMMVAPASGGAAPVLPTSVSNLWAWYKRGDFYSDAGSTLQTTNGGSVQQWSDSSGNGRHLSRTTQKPTVDTGTVHLTKNTLHFVPAGSFQALNFPAGPGGGVTDGEYFIVLKAANNTPAASRCIFEITSSGSGGQNLFPDTAGHIREGFATNSSHDCGAHTTADAFHVLNGGIDSSQVLETRLDTVLIGNPTLVSHSFSQTGFLGTDGVTASPFDGWVFELVVFTRKLTSLERAGIYAYLTS